MSSASAGPADRAAVRQRFARSDLYRGAQKTYAAADKLLRELAELDKAKFAAPQVVLERLKEYFTPASQRDHNKQ